MIATNKGLGNSWGMVKQVGPGGGVALRGPTAVNGQARTWIDPRGWDKPTSGVHRNVGKRVASITVNPYEKVVKGKKAYIDKNSRGFHGHAGLMANDRAVLEKDRHGKAVPSGPKHMSTHVEATDLNNQQRQAPKLATSGFGGVAGRREAAAEAARRRLNDAPTSGSTSSGEFFSARSGTPSSAGTDFFSERGSVVGSPRSPTLRSPLSANKAMGSKAMAQKRAENKKALNKIRQEKTHAQLDNIGFAQAAKRAKSKKGVKPTKPQMTQKGGISRHP